MRKLIWFSQHGEIELEVVYVVPDEDSDDENHDYEDENGFRLSFFSSLRCFFFITFHQINGDISGD